MNQFQCDAVLSEKDALRYTPAGIPILNVKLAHSSQQVEAGLQRMVEFEMSAVAVGEVSKTLSQMELGETLRFTGFMARRNRNSKSLVFHITDFKNIPI